MAGGVAGMALQRTLIGRRVERQHHDPPGEKRKVYRRKRPCRHQTLAESPHRFEGAQQLQRTKSHQMPAGEPDVQIEK